MDYPLHIGGAKLRRPRSIFGAFAVATAVLLSPPVARADATDYPVQPVRIIVPWAPGGASDVVARALARFLQGSLGQPFTVENRTGAGGIIGARYVSQASADGYTLLLGSNAELAQYPSVSANIPYDARTDFAPIGLLADVPVGLVVTKSLPVGTYAELLTYAKEHPGTLSYGSGGVGSTTHLAMELLKFSTGLEVTHVPYKGSGAVTPDLIAGNIQLAFLSLPAVVPFVESGQLKIIAVSTPKRAPRFPNVPSLDELGVRGYEASIWNGLLAPRGTPIEVIEKLYGALSLALDGGELKDALAEQGAELLRGGPKEFESKLSREIAVWTDLAEKTNIHIQ